MRSLESRASCHLRASSRKKTNPAHLAGLAALTLALLLATDALAGDLWWVGRGIDDRWNTYGNWEQFGSANAGAIPDARASVYITTSEHEGLSALPAALIDDRVLGATVGRAAQLYVGGWLWHLDAVHGDPTIHGGELNVSGGKVVVDNYTRLGVRGAEGTINQTGGTLYTTIALVLGFLHAESLGTYNLSGGNVVARYIDIGRQGTGVFNMTGGHVWWTRNTSSVGQGYTAGDGHYIPGHGFLYVGGGIFDTSSLWVGRFEDSTGEIVVEGDGRLFASGSIRVGDHASGAILQSGGSIEVGVRLELGRQPGGEGLYRIDGGALYGLSDGLYVGMDGAGRLEIEGAAGEIDIDGVYEQNDQSVLSVTLDASDDHVSTIRVEGTAWFARGAALRIRQARHYRPSVGDAFVLLTAEQGVIDDGLQIVGEKRKHWLLDTSAGNNVTVVYVGPGKGGRKK